WVLRLFGVFFKAEDGIRDWSVTGVQTCALPIWPPAGEHDGRVERRIDRAGPGRRLELGRSGRPRGKAEVVLLGVVAVGNAARAEIGRASCRERAKDGVGAVS